MTPFVVFLARLVQALRAFLCLKFIIYQAPYELAVLRCSDSFGGALVIRFRIGVARKKLVSNKN